MVSKIDEFLALKTTSDDLATKAKAIKTALMSNPPSPLTGYKKDATVGATKDVSPPDRIIARHKTLKQAKKDFETVIVEAAVVTESSKGNPPTSEKMWWLAVAPLAAPGHSLHGTGYALDISGNNVESTRISKGVPCSCGMEAWRQAAEIMNFASPLGQAKI